MREKTTSNCLRYIVLIYLLLCTSSFSFSQVTLTSTNIPHVGDIFYNKLIDTAMTTGPTGPNVTWNYTAFFIYPQTLNETYVAPSATPFSSTFPSANLAVNSYFFSTTSGYDYFISSAGGLQYLGFKDQFNEIIITNTQNILTVPLQYGQSVSNLPVTGTGLSGATLTGTVSATADAWGILTLDDGNYNDALRVVYDFNLTSSFGPGTETFYHIQKYTWYSSSRRNPELQISFLDITGATTAHNKIVTRAASLAGVNENESIFSRLEILNNPVDTEAEFNIQLKSRSDVRLEILDIQGRSWKNEMIHSDKLNRPVKMDVSELPCGVYLVSVTAQGYKQQARFIVD